MSFSLTFQIELSSDYHLSSGHRSEEVDSALFRDADGLPALRGTTVAALLRDGMRRLILTGALKNITCTCQASGLSEKPDVEKLPQYCGQFEELPEDKFCPVCKILGSPKAIKAWSISSARPSELNTLDTGKDVNANWGAQETMRVRVDPRTRRAEARKLFSQEEGDSRLIFEFTITSVTQNEHAREQAALIVAAARMVRNFGGSRRRGRGECVFTLIKVNGESADNNAWLDKFKTFWIDGNPLTDDQNAAPTKFATPQRQAATGSALRLRLIVRADEPILVARRAESGNEFEGSLSIPGTVVRGAFAQKAAAIWGDLKDKDIRAVFVELFFSGKLRFSPLYPAFQDGSNIRPALPPPRDFHTCKLHCGLDERDADVMWHLREGSALKGKKCSRCSEDLERVEEFLYVSPTGELKKMKIRHGLEMHNTINPITERVEETNLFAYQPLESGQYFMGEIVCDDGNLWPLFKDFAGLPKLEEAFSLGLGKAARRGYGRATAMLAESKRADTPLWIGQPLATRVTSADDGESLVLTFLSDAIIPDCWGRFHSGFEKTWLKKELGMEVTIDDQFVSAREVDSFNAHLKLPRWRDWAIAAGSSCKIQISSQETEKLKTPWAQQTGNVAASPDAALLALQWHLSKLEFEGLGLRRNEGFGMIAFNHPLYENAAALKDRRFPLPQALQLQTLAEKAAFSREPKFRKEWNGIMDDDLKFDECNDPKFGAVARLFRAEKNTGIAALKNRLTTLGKRNNLDRDLPENESNWFQKKGDKGVEQIRAALNRLESHIVSVAASQETSNRLAAIGIELLAERIAEEALKEGEKR